MTKYVNSKVIVIDNSNSTLTTVDLRDLLSGLVKTDESKTYLLTNNPRKNTIINNGNPLVNELVATNTIWMFRDDVDNINASELYESITDPKIDVISIVIFNIDNCFLASSVLNISKSILLDVDVVNGDNYTETPLMGYTDCISLIKSNNNGSYWTNWTSEIATFKTIDIDRLTTLIKLMITSDDQHLILDSNESKIISDPICEYLESNLNI